MRIDIEVTPAGTPKENNTEGHLRMKLTYDQVMLKAPGGGFNLEAAQIFQDRPFDDRYKMIRAGQVVFLRNGKPIDPVEMLRMATASR